MKKNITQNSTIPERITDAENITQNYTILEQVPFAKKYNTNFHNTWARSTGGKYMTKNPQYQSALHTQKDITQYQSEFHMQGNITQNYTLLECVTHTEKYNTKFHKNRAHFTCGIVLYNTRPRSTHIKI